MKLSTILLMLAAVFQPLFAAASSEEPSSDYGNCNTSLSTLEAALYSTRDNKVKLNAYFFPPRKEFVSYAKITYQFEDEDGEVPDEEEEKCKVTFVWAEGGFLLMQPPSIFTFSSLLFFHTRQSDFDLVLTLPQPCKSLVYQGNGTCTCGNDSNALDILNQQIRLYAQYNDPNHVQAGTNVLVQAECYNKLAKDYFENSGIHVYLAYTLCLPLLFTVALVAMVRSMSVPITKKLSNSLGHPNVAGLVLMGVFLHILCLAMDVTAVYFMWQDRELRDMPSVDLHRHLNFFATWVTLGLDLIVSLLVVLCAMYLQCHNTQNHTLFKKVFQWVFSPLFYLIFGEYDQEAFWDAVYTEPQPQPAVARDQGVVVIQHGASEGITNAAANPDNATANPTITNPVDNPVVNTVVDNTAEKSKRQHIAWIVCFMQLAPFFSLASHIGYIFAAWLTNPYKATSVSLIILGVSVCMYMMFRQCYIANKNATWTKCEKWFLLCSPLCQVFKCVLNCLCLCLRKKYFPQERQRDSYETLLGEKRKVDKIFDTSAFCVAFAWGWPIVGTMVFLFCAFYKLPVASYNLPLYLLNAFQVFIVVITLLITYKILSINDPVLHGFLRNMKEAYLRRAPGGDRNVRMEGDEVEEGANLIGELVGVVVHELKRERSNEN